MPKTSDAFEIRVIAGSTEIALATARTLSEACEVARRIAAARKQLVVVVDLEGQTQALVEAPE